LTVKKLFVDAHTFDENHQGIRTFIKGIYEHVTYDPDALIIYLAANNIENLKKEFKSQMNFKYIELKTTNRYVRLAYEIPKLIKRHNFDYAHFNYFLPLALNKRCKYIVTIHDVLFIDFPKLFPLKYRLINTFLYRRSAKKSYFLTSVSNYSAERIRTHFKTKDKTITILPNAINDRYKTPRDKPQDKIYIKDNYGIENYILYVSRIEPRKNHIKVMKAYSDLKLCERNFSLLFIGIKSIQNDDYEETFDEVSKESNGLLYRIEDIPNDDLVRFYNAAYATVFPSLCEGFGIPPIEAAALNTPTLCSNATAMRDFKFFEDYLFDASSLDTMKEKLVKIIEENDKEETQKKIERISNTIKNTYDWNRTSDLFISLILND
jgi:glycosyltransferase involved in cell wall biosynthesis